MTAYVGFAEFDTQAEPNRAHVGWVEFDAQAATSRAFVGFAEFDASAGVEGSALSFPVGGGGGGYGSRSNWSRYSSHYDSVEKKYNIPVQVDESEEEEVLMQILMEIASHEL